MLPPQSPGDSLLVFPLDSFQGRNAGFRAGTLGFHRGGDAAVSGEDQDPDRRLPVF
jgi:hypothetical protein